MADRYLLETSATDGYLLEDGSGVLLLEQSGAACVPEMSLMGVSRCSVWVVAVLEWLRARKNKRRTACIS